MNVNKETGEIIKVEGKKRNYGERIETITTWKAGCKSERIRKYDVYNELLAEYPGLHGRIGARVTPTKRIAEYHPLCDTADNEYYIHRNNRNDLLLDRFLPLELGYELLPGLIQSIDTLPWSKNAYAEEVYTANMHHGTAVYPGELRGFLDLNLIYFYPQWDGSEKMLVYVLVRVDELGNVTSAETPIIDKKGASAALKRLFAINPLFSPAFVNGLPVTSFYLLEVLL